MLSVRRRAGIKKKIMLKAKIIDWLLFIPQQAFIIGGFFLLGYKGFDWLYLSLGVIGFLILIIRCLVAYVYDE